MAEHAMRYLGAPERRQVILEQLGESGFVSVSDLTEMLGVSDMTVRRDLRLLASDGAVRVVHGGVSSLQGSLHNPAFTNRASMGATAKAAIARRALDLVGSTDTVAIDAGTTAYALAQALPADFDGTIVTHSVPVVALTLSRGRGRLVALGGELLQESQAFAGQMTVDAASGLRVKTLFLGAAAIDERGVYVATDKERPTKLALIDIADQVVLLADHNTFANSAPVLLCPHERVDILVTDRQPPAATADHLRSVGTDVILAS